MREKILIGATILLVLLVIVAAVMTEKTEP